MAAKHAATCQQGFGSTSHSTLGFVVYDWSLTHTFSGQRNSCLFHLSITVTQTKSTPLLQKGMNLRTRRRLPALKTFGPRPCPLCQGGTTAHFFDRQSQCLSHHSCPQRPLPEIERAIGASPDHSGSLQVFFFFPFCWFLPFIVIIAWHVIKNVSVNCTRMSNPSNQE